IPIIDIRLRFGLEERAYDDRTCILITEIDGVRIGFIVDSVEEVMEITEANIEPPPKFKSASGGEGYISGLGKAEGAVKILLDIEKIIRDDDIRSLAEGSKTMSA
ncbi:MAG: chemotaxis protein CheW, partial [Spirochaetota bacterium]